MAQPLLAKYNYRLQNVTPYKGQPTDKLCNGCEPRINHIMVETLKTIP